MKTSPLRIRYIFLMSDDSKAGSDGLFFASDRRLIDLSRFLEVLIGLPRGTTEYLPSVPRKSLLNNIFGFNSFAIAFISESNFNNEAIGSLDNYPLKVLFLKEDMNEETVHILETWKNRPLILVERDDFASYLRLRFKSTVLPIEGLKLSEFEMELCNIVGSLMSESSYVQSLPWSDKQVEILKQLPDLIKNQKKSIFPVWPLRRNRMIAPIDLIINRNRGHIESQEMDIESSEELWVQESVSAAVRCFAEMSLMEALAYFENKELNDKDFVVLETDKASFLEILKGDQEKFDQVVNKFSARYDLLQRNHGLMIWSPTVNPYFHKKIFAVLKGAYNKSLGKRIPDRIFNAFLKDTGYKFKFSPKELLKDDQDKELQELFLELIEEYAKENNLLSIITTFFSLRNNRPRIKTQKMASSFFGRMRQLQNMVSQDQLGPETIKKFVELWKAFRTDLTNSVPVEIRDLLRSLPKMPIQFVSDLPLEWMEIDGTPLMFARELSRLPLTSANGLVSHYQITEEPLHISKDINKPVVLLIDGLLEEDRVKSLTKSTLDLLGSKEFSSIFDISRKEVRNKEELFHIIQEKKPFICLIDAHAEYDTTDDMGYLHVGNYRWNPWGEPLPYAPPIMILNSCQTSVVDGTFNTAANGLLANGVRSIVGTLFPISAEVGAYMCSRLFANLAAVLTGEDKLLTWRTVVSKTIMLNHYLDYFIQFKNYLMEKQPEKVCKLDRFVLDYTAKWNREKAKEQKTFEDIVFETVSEVMKDYGLVEEFNQFIERRGILPETSFFISLGTPESIFTFDPERAKNHFSILTRSQ